MRDSNSPLNNLKVASPCPADWNKMYGDDRKRFCGECKLNVYNLSGMTRPEAERLLTNAEGRLCVRYYQRADGTVLTQDCPVGWRLLKKRVTNLAAAVCSLLLGIITFFALNFNPARDEAVVGKLEPQWTKPTPTPKTTPHEEPLMGAIAMPSPTPGQTPKPLPSPSPGKMMGKYIAG